MDDQRRQALIEAIFATRDDEIDCARFMDVVAAYVDVEVDGGDGAAVAPGVPHHLRMCPECAELYQALAVVSELEAKGALPEADALWSDLAAAAGKAEEETTPSSTPAPQPPGHESADGRPFWRRWFSSSVIGPVFVGAGAAMALVAAVGWMQYTERMEEMAAEMNDMRQVMEVMSAAPGVSHATTRDGDLVRVFFNPASSSFVVADDGAHQAAGTSRQCWLVGQDGRRVRAGTFEVNASGPSWWLMKADEPLAAYEALALTAGEGEELLTINLQR